MDYVLEWMKKNNLPLTREKYLEMAYLGNPPAELSVEEELMLPEEFQVWDADDDWASVLCPQTLTAGRPGQYADQPARSEA